jgi:outer membrane murein-binding lipoprotein Lpp
MSSHNRGDRTLRSGWMAAALIGVVLLAGCVSDPPEKKTSEVGGSIEDQLGFTRTGITAAQAKVENRIAACMKEQGFEYIPADPIAQQAALTGKPNMSDAEFEQQFGYGISTLYGRGNPQSDPNERIRSSLSGPDKTAYEQALTGGNPDQTFFAAVDSGDFSELGGCTKTATDEAFGGSELLTTLQRKLDELDDSILADQRMVRANEAWTDCMRSATGSSYEDAEAIEDEIRTAFAKIIPEPVTPGQVAVEGNYDKAALVALQRREVDVANKDMACEKKHVTPVEDVVRKQKESEFRDQNATLLSTVKPLG